MSYYTAKYLRDLLADVPDDEPVAGILMLRNEYMAPVDDTEREITPEEWGKVVDKWEIDGGNGVFEATYESLRDAISEVCSEPDTGSYYCLTCNLHSGSAEEICIDCGNPMEWLD